MKPSIIFDSSIVLFAIPTIERVYKKVRTVCKAIRAINRSELRSKIMIGKQPRAL
jgi:hypothetical protein